MARDIFVKFGFSEQGDDTVLITRRIFGRRGEPEQEILVVTSLGDLVQRKDKVELNEENRRRLAATNVRETGALNGLEKYLTTYLLDNANLSLRRQILLTAVLQTSQNIQENVSPVR